MVWLILKNQINDTFLQINSENASGVTGDVIQLLAASMPLQLVQSESVVCSVTWDFWERPPGNHQRQNPTRSFTFKVSFPIIFPRPGLAWKSNKRQNKDPSPIASKHLNNTGDMRWHIHAIFWYILRIDSECWSSTSASTLVRASSNGPLKYCRRCGKR